MEKEASKPGTSATPLNDPKNTKTQTTTDQNGQNEAVTKPEKEAPNTVSTVKK